MKSSVINMKGKVFGKWTVIDRDINDLEERAMWLCRCECGTERVVRGKDLRNGKSKSCGICIKKGMNVISMIGQKYGTLTVLSYEGEDKYGNTTWQCLCDCGRKRVATGYKLRQGSITSCGHHGNPTHGLSKTRLYRIWAGMNSRCYTPSATAFKHYGGRGITICNEWKNDFTKFYDWSIKNGYTDELTIDRIDNDGNYEPANCRWVTNAIQQKNKRRKSI